MTETEELTAELNRLVTRIVERREWNSGMPISQLRRLICHFAQTDHRIPVDERLWNLDAAALDSLIDQLNLPAKFPASPLTVQ